MTAVNPPGFDMHNAMSTEDIINVATQSVWRNSGAILGRMLTEDRHALMSDAREWLTDAVAMRRLADMIKGNIEHAVIWGTDEQITAIY